MMEKHPVRPIVSNPLCLFAITCIPISKFLAFMGAAGVSATVCLEKWQFFQLYFLRLMNFCSVGKDPGKDVLYLIACSPVCLSVITQTFPVLQANKHFGFCQPNYLW